MADTKRMKKKAAPYVRRTLNDERVHRHVADAAAGVRKAYRRASRKGGAEAVEDRKVYGYVRQAAASGAAALRIVSAPEPKPKRRGRKLLLALAAAAAAVVAVRKRRGGADGPRQYDDRPAEPVEPGREAHGAAPTPSHA
jgi:ferric-dicitrate binding protein FerR (iron transport regulator)